MTGTHPQARSDHRGTPLPEAVLHRGARPGAALGMVLAITAASMLAAPAGAAADGAAPDNGAGGQGPAWIGAGAFTKVYDTAREDPARYINDHSLIQAPDGTWHLFGITGEEAPPGEAPDSAQEKEFAHATAPDLAGPWTTRKPVLTVDPDYGEDHLWAPHVIEHGGTYYMFYSGGGGERDAQINLATSTDLENWTREPSGTLFRDGWVARDPFVIRDGDRWIMYYTATETPGGGRHVVAYRTSTDLVNWGERRIAFADEATKEDSAPVTESPFVIRRGDWWYLLIGPRGDGYTGTDVFRSKDPTDFGLDGYAGHFPAHAPEVVEDKGRWWVTHSGWFQDGIHLAPLHWRSTPPPWHSVRNPAVARAADGRLEAYALKADGRGVQRRVQRTPGGDWGPWRDFGSAPATVPTVAANADGGLELFAVADDGALLHRRQAARTGEWGSWRRLGGRAGAAPEVVRGRGGRLEMFGIAPGGVSLTHRSQDGPNGAWGPERRFGGPAAAPPAAAADAEGRMHVFAIERGGARMVHRVQDAAGGWGEWRAFSGPASGRPVVAADADGRLEVFRLGPYGDTISRRGQTGAAGEWGEWADFGGFAGGTPAVARNEDGRLEVFAVGPGNDYVAHRRQAGPSGEWGEWRDFGGPAQCAPSPVEGADGRLTVLVLQTEAQGIAARTQAAPNGAEWSQWRPFASAPVGGSACGAAS